MQQEHERKLTVEEKRERELQSLRATSESLDVARETVQKLSEQSGRRFCA